MALYPDTCESEDQRKNQIPTRLVLDDEGDELAEEVQVGDRWVTDELRIPIRITDGGMVRDPVP